MSLHRSIWTYNFAALPFRRFLADLHEIRKVSSPQHVLDPIKIPEQSVKEQCCCDVTTGDFQRFLTLLGGF